MASNDTVPADAYPADDAAVPGFVADLGLPGLIDIHVHFLPHRLQEAVWGYFDRLTEPPWPILYREEDEQDRLDTLRRLGVVAHTALAYAHRPGMLRWLNDHTLDLADRHPQVIPTFTLHPEDGVTEAVADALDRGGAVAKVHLQVGRFDPLDPRLAEVWPMLAAARVPIVIHAGAVYGVDGGDAWCGPRPVARLLDAHPDLVLVVAHLGATDVEGFVTLAEQAPTLRLDTALALTDPPYLTEVPDALLPRIAALWPRLLYGSDVPSVPRDVASQLRGIGRLGLGRRELRALLHDNAAQLLDAVATAPSWPSGR